MTAMRPLVGVLACVCLLSAAPARADVVTDWNLIGGNIIDAAAPSGPFRLCDYAMMHIAIHDAIQSIQHRFETYSPGTTASGSVIAAAATAAREVLASRFPAAATVAALDATYLNYLQVNQLTVNDPGVAAGRLAAAAIIQNRVGDGGFPVPAPTFFGGMKPGEWRPTSFSPMGEPVSMAFPWLGTMRTFAVTHSGQMFSGAPPRLTSRRYTREYNEVKALGSAVGSTRTPEQTAIANFYSQAPWNYYNRSLRALADKYVPDVGENARMFALANVAMADAGMTSWQAKLQHNFWRPSTAIQLGDSDGNRATVGDPAWRPLFTTPNYPDYTSGASSLAGAWSEIMKLFFRTDRVNFSLISTNGVRDYTRFSDVAQDVVDARIYMGIHFRAPDTAGRSAGQRVARWAYKHYLRSLDGDEFDFVRSLDSVEGLSDEDVDEDDGQDDEDAEQ
jgi:hypothetical protein